jgi:hypothetical protein
MDSRMTKLVFYPLNWYQLQDEIPDDDNKYKVVILDNRQLSVLHSVVNTFLPYYWVWGISRYDPAGRAAVLEYKCQLEETLMSVLSVDDLIKTNLMIVAAITGQTVDLDNPETHLAGDYTPNGLTPAVTTVGGMFDEKLSDINTNVAGIVTTIGDQIDKLEEIRSAIAAQATDPEQLAGDLEGIANTIQTVATILGVLV